MHRSVADSGEGSVMVCDLPAIPAGKLPITQLAAVAPLEAGFIGQRTKAALTEAKRRGVKLGDPRLRAAIRRRHGSRRMLPQPSRRSGRRTCRLSSLRPMSVVKHRASEHNRYRIRQAFQILT